MLYTSVEVQLKPSKIGMDTNRKIKRDKNSQLRENERRKQAAEIYNLTTLDTRNTCMFHIRFSIHK